MQCLERVSVQLPLTGTATIATGDGEEIVPVFTKFPEVT
jgi:hypothetical protein